MNAKNFEKDHPSKHIKIINN